MRRRDLLLGFYGVAAAPLSARAQQQQKIMPTIGFLSVFSPEAAGPRLAALRQGLAKAGYVEDRNLKIEYRWGRGHHDRMPALAADLVGRGVDLILTNAPPAARAAKRATATIPIVFVVGTDPVREGMVASLARPGGNMTGIGFLIGDLEPKRLELLSELVPAAKTMALLTNPTNPDVKGVVSDVQKAAQAMGLQLDVFRASIPNEIDAAFDAAAQRRAGALLVGIDSFFTIRREQIVALAAHHALPTIYAFREFVSAGGLISYGTDIAAVLRQAGIYAGKILAGAKPADLPVQQPTKFELIINLKTAKELGLTVPQSVLARADEVIE